jgi:hypothetical protein
MKPIIRLLVAQASSTKVVDGDSRKADRKHTTTLGHVVGRTPHHFKNANSQSSGVCIGIVGVLLFTLMRSDMPLSSMESDVLYDRAS